MKKAIVTGSNGFVGSNVCKRLCADGVKVFAVVKDENEKIDNIEKLDGIEIVYCELDEIETLFDKISDRDVDVFYHFAWVGSAGPLRCDENIQLQNALWTARTLRIADKCSAKVCKRRFDYGKRNLHSRLHTGKQTGFAVHLRRRQTYCPFNLQTDCKQP